MPFLLSMASAALVKDLCATNPKIDRRWLCLDEKAMRELSDFTPGRRKVTAACGLRSPSDRVRFRARAERQARERFLAPHS